MSIEKRRPEKDEVFNEKDAKAYATGCDFKEGIKKPQTTLLLRQKRLGCLEGEVD